MVFMFKRKFNASFMLLVLLLFSIAALPAQGVEVLSSAKSLNRSSGVVPGEVIVVMKDSQAYASSSGTARISAQTARISAVASSVNAKVKKTYPALSGISDNKIFALVHSDTKSETQLLNELKANPDVLAVSLNYKVFASASSTPNDTYYSALWGIKAVNAEKVWSKGYTGSSNVYVAVIDSGIDYNHEDLSANFYSSYSRNFVSSSSSYYDGNGHGSHVSGTIAGIGNNGKGVTGINWNAKIIALKVLDDNGSGDFGKIVEALNYLTSLVTSNPSINLAAVNLSLEGYWSTTPANMKRDSIWIAFNTFSQKNKAVMCVAAGNENIKIGEPASANDNEGMYKKGDYCYPASFTGIDNMIVVAAANNDSSYSKASFSNYSSQYADIAAPGTRILSTFPSNRYFYYEGTSMATPHVAGAAALLKSIVPSATASQIKNAILQGANKNYAGSYTRYGFLDIDSALSILNGGSSTNTDTNNNNNNNTNTDDNTTSGLTITGSFSNGTVGQSYSSSVTASGGGSSYSWSYSGKIPSNLRLTASGATVTLSGTPSTSGTYTFTLYASSNGLSTSKAFTVTISGSSSQNQSMTINGTLPEGTRSTRYNGSLTVTGGTAPYSWSYSGSLPSGMSIYYADSYYHRGVNITGTPYATGTYNITLYVKDNNGSQVSKTFSIKISDSGSSSRLSMTGTLPNPARGVYYNSTIKVTGGTSPYSWSYSGSLPYGLSAYLSDSKGSGIIIRGTPRSTGTYSFTLTVKDRTGASYSKSFRLYTSKQSFSGAFKDSVMGKSYTSSISLNGGTKPYKLSYSGSLPKGLKLSLSGSKVKLTGKPLKSGTYSFTLTFTDKNGNSVSEKFTVKVSAATSKSSESESKSKSSGIKAQSGFAYPAVVDDSISDNSSGYVEYTEPEAITLKIADENILESGTDKDEDLFTVKADEPVRFIIENYEDLSDVEIFLDFEPYEDKYEEGLEISDDGEFILPAELVHDDFVVSVKAMINGQDAESQELYISAE